MIPMICSKSMPYAGRRINQGDPFEARTASDARLLAAIGKATYAVQTLPAPTPLPIKPVVQPPVHPHAWRAMLEAEDFPMAEPVVEPAANLDAPTPEAVDTDEQTDHEIKPKRQYHRRDMTAE